MSERREDLRAHFKVDAESIAEAARKLAARLNHLTTTAVVVGVE